MQVSNMESFNHNKKWRTFCCQRIFANSISDGYLFSCSATPASVGPSGRTSTTRRSPPQPRAEPTLAAKAAAEAGDPGSPGAEGSEDHPDRCLAAAFHIPADFS